jgi:hypothetical protein
LKLSFVVGKRMLFNESKLAYNAKVVDDAIKSVPANHHLQAMKALKKSKERDYGDDESSDKEVEEKQKEQTGEKPTTTINTVF